MFNMELEKLQKIYSKMIDEKSKDIYLNRILYSITSDSRYILNIIEILDLKENFSKLLFSNKKIYVFGAGEMGKTLVRFFPMVDWKSFIDNYSTEKEIEGLKVIRVDELKKEYSNEPIVICSVYYNEMYQQLIREGFKDDSIINIGKTMKSNLERQYFEIPYEENKQESFVDAGCYEGETSKGFINWCKGNYSNVWAFEPETALYKKCKGELALPKCSVYNLGLFDKEGISRFNTATPGSSCIDNNGKTQIETVKLDNVLKDKKVTFIKMDIEGAELGALKGAEHTIRTQKPKLAICVYHKPDDIFTIPSLLLEYNPEYKFKMKHYSCFDCETVLYAF